jgi:hypothetical protein
MVAMKDKLKNANLSQKAFGKPKKGRFHELKQCILEYVREKHNEGFRMQDMHQDTGTIVPHANTSKVHSQYRMGHLDDEIGQTDFAAAYNTHTKTSWGIS